MKPFIISIEGYRHSGKSALAGKLKQKFAIRGIRAGFLENCDGPSIEAERETDPGASCQICGDSFTFRGSLSELFDLREFVQKHMGDHDLVFVEGFPGLGVPKIEVIDNSQGKRRILTTPEEGLFMIVLSEPGVFAPMVLPEIPRIPVGQIERIQDTIQERIRLEQSRREEEECQVVIRPPNSVERQLLSQMFLKMFQEEEYTRESREPQLEKAVMDFYRVTGEKFGFEGQAMAWCDGRPAGFAWVLKMKHFLTGEDMAMVGSIYVEPWYRDRGVGRSLMEWAEKYSHQMGYSRMTLNVFAGNQKAMAMYESLGLKLISHQMEKHL